MSPIVPAHTRRRSRSQRTDWEGRLARYIELEGLPQPVRQYRFAAPARQFRFDFCWPELGLALEINGGTFMVKSRHTSGMGMMRDAEKNNLAVLMGYRVLQITDRMFRNGEAEALVKRVLTGPPITYTPPIWAPSQLGADSDF